VIERQEKTTARRWRVRAASVLI